MAEALLTGHLRWQELECDVLVAGGGMAGVCAALAAARNGARVVLIQDRSVLGGNASSEVRMHIVGADCHGRRKGWRESGLMEELRLEDAVHNPTRAFPYWDVLIYDRVVAEPNITLLLETDVVAVEMAEGRSPGEEERPPRTGRLYEYRGQPGRIGAVHAVRQITQDAFRIRARFFCDCTGDGRLGYEAGADFRIGREAQEEFGESFAMEQDDCQTLGSSILLTTRRHDRPIPFTPPSWARRFTEEDFKVGRRISSWEYGFWWVEWGGQLDSIKDHVPTIRHELLAICLGIWDYIKNSGKFDAGHWALEWIGAMPGKRESRRFLGPYMLTQPDLWEARTFPDDVAYGGWPIDDHPPSGIDAKHEPPLNSRYLARPYGIPLRCLYSRNISNMLMAGRDISATHIAFASTRVMATCAVIGQAAGTAAAYCARHGLSGPAEIVADGQHMAALQQVLLRDDATLLAVVNADAEDLARRARATATSSDEGCGAERVIDGHLRSEIDSETGREVTSHQWRSRPGEPLPQTLTLEWERPVTLGTVHLTFDTGFQRQLTLSASDRTNDTVVRGPQPETVRDYRVEARGEDGQWRVVAAAEGNYQRQRVHPLGRPVETRALRLVALATQGDPSARVFEIRCYPRAPGEGA